MPTAGKLFRLRQQLSLERLEERLDGFREESDAGLVRDVTDLTKFPQRLRGLYRYDQLVEIKHRSGMQVVPKTVDAPFIFLEEGEIYLLVLAPKRVANRSAVDLGLAAYREENMVVEPVLNPALVKQFYEDSETTKILLLDEMITVNMDKMTIYGEDVVQTDMYGDYVGMGTPWYVVAKDRDGNTVGVVRDGSVTMFNTVDETQYISYIVDNIIPLVMKR